MKKPKIIPRGQYVLVRPDEAQLAIESASGLSVPPKTEKEQRAQGIVEAVSREITDLKKGDRCIYGAYAGEDAELEGENFKLLHSDDIIATLE